MADTAAEDETVQAPSRFCYLLQDVTTTSTLFAYQIGSDFAQEAKDELTQKVVKLTKADILHCSRSDQQPSEIDSLLLSFDQSRLRPPTFW